MWVTYAFPPHYHHDHSSFRYSSLPCLQPPTSFQLFGLISLLGLFWNPLAIQKKFSCILLFPNSTVQLPISVREEQGRKAPKGTHLCRAGLRQTHNMQPVAKPKRTAGLLYIYDQSMCLMTDQHHKSKLHILRLQKSVLASLSFLATFRLSFIFTAFCYVL